MSCPVCSLTRYHVRDGTIAAGSQRMWCQSCGTRSTPHPKAQGAAPATRSMAVRMVAEGINLRRAARLLQVHHTTILRGKQAAAARLPSPPPQPQLVDEIERDALYTCIGSKKVRVSAYGG